jgi:hypothetical protein
VVVVVLVGVEPAVEVVGGAVVVDALGALVVTELVATPEVGGAEDPEDEHAAMPSALAASASSIHGRGPPGMPAP